MTKSYFKNCDICKERIEMSDKEGKWRAYNLNNGPHDCQKNGNGREKQQSKEARKEFTLEQVRKKLESIGIIINVERLMKQE